MMDNMALDDHGSNAESYSSGKLSEASGTSETSFGASSKESSKQEQENILAQAETKAVFRLRLLVIAILFLAAAGVSAYIYLATSNAEYDEFVAQFEGSAAIVLARFENILTDNLGAISTISVAMTAYSIDHGSKWPFVSTSFIQQRFSKTNQLAGSLYLGFNPLVQEGEKDAWEEFTADPESREWIREGLEYQERTGLNAFDEATADDPLNEALVGSTHMNYNAHEWEDPREDGPGPYLPVWQTSPVLRQDLVNKNRLRDPVFAYWANMTLNTNSAVLGIMELAPAGYSSHPNRETRFFATLLSMRNRQRTIYGGDPMTDMYIPVFDSFSDNRKSLAVLRTVFHWKSYFLGILSPVTPDISVVLRNSCQGDFTYVIRGGSVEPIGQGDLHDSKFDDLEMTTSFEGLEDIGDGSEFGLKLNQNECQYSIRVYPTINYYKEYNTTTPLTVTFAVALVFIFTMCMFLFYDHLVERRQRVVMRKAQQSTAIVSSLFPKAVRDRLLEDEADKKKSFMAPTLRLKNYLGGDDDINKDNVIADLFPNCSVLFADIVGFTAWSSARDPSQVFQLLQTIYQSFDMIAKRRHVFKVETIGDTYVAVTGLPDPQPDHAVIMARFANECRKKLVDITEALEVTLGPDTADLGMRFGLHSGPVTAGVLRGDRSRFQLFGDTVNTAARMESTGMSMQIHASAATAKKLITAGKESWLEHRKDAVRAKGKGILETYWLHPASRKKSSNEDASSVTMLEEADDSSIRHGLITTGLASKDSAFFLKESRRIDWVAGLFEEHLKKVIAGRLDTHKPKGVIAAIYEPVEGKIPLDEITDTVDLTEFDILKTKANASMVHLSEEVISQIRDYVAAIAQMYHANPFHNFEHACHVTMSVVKLLKRVVTPEIDVNECEFSVLASKLHDYTYGITSDPMATLAIIFSALIHDVDHRGVSNTQLEKEEPEMAALYRSKSIAEQNSLDLAWGILMQHKYSAFRGQLFMSNDDINHFRQVAVNVVLATDIFDKELNARRKNRWNRAFSEHRQELADDKALKATIVIEHIIQASDVSHTMQHWHIYRRWNERLFMEMSEAYKAGRLSADPATFWLEGEIGFFDNYIIPLAKKLKDCGVFGVSSDEYLNYALSNREEWREKGKDILLELVAKRGFD